MGSWGCEAPPDPLCRRGLKDMELDTSSIEKRFAYGFLQQLLKWMDISQEFIAHLGTAPGPLKSLGNLSSLSLLGPFWSPLETPLDLLRPP